MKEYFGASPKLQAAAFYLRYKIFVLEQTILPELEFDKLDTTDRQYLVFFEGNLPIATVRYQKIAEQTLNPDRLCVHPDFRTQGFGKKLLTQIEERARKEGCHTSILSAEIQAQRFYEKLGYHVSSAPFEEDGILCVQMQKALIAE
ncbi:GNAT family N-acetyltransferase [Enterococcus xiangfangensis]|uniref:GNAT family N-acetyltransferase n=1 Tax=Enterococcus xiangfangensis TaxID=1296537 RepID=A0ABU3FC90_9ENTE|nr:GNAT family N-acetyltransferase [Enterococcus xiangfangensis]MBM7711823.1 putative GNAT family N-acyltransferase [Enterococcus xiangfangensis]MDT2760284.1 GNAT family N-acetyltransferase [Enterococcus xiangfangensis]NBK07451.1 GNAT family N-acetyltransferase [Enterococcus asini]